MVHVNLNAVGTTIFIIEGSWNSSFDTQLTQLQNYHIPAGQLSTINLPD
jgi:hypothetical protein